MTHRLTASLAATLLTTICAPSWAQEVDPEPHAPRAASWQLAEEPSRRPNAALLATGVSTFAVSYSFTATAGIFLATVSCRAEPAAAGVDVGADPSGCGFGHAPELMTVPVVGPFAALASIEELALNEPLAGALAGAGAAQLLGLGLTIGSVIADEPSSVEARAVTVVPGPGSLSIHGVF